MENTEERTDEQQTEVVEESRSELFGPDITYYSGGKRVEAPDEEEVETAEEGAAEEAQPESSQEETETDIQPPSDEALEAVAEVADTPPEHWRFKVDGTEVVVEGAREDGDSIVIPRDQWQRTIQPRLADRGAISRQIQQANNAIAAIRDGKHPEVARARTIVERLTEVLEGGEERLDRFFQNIDSERELISALAEKAAAEAERSMGEILPPAPEAPSEPDQVPDDMIDWKIEQLLESARAHPMYKDKDYEAVKAQLAPIRRALVFKAEQDRPDWQLRKGEVGLRLDVIQNILDSAPSKGATPTAQPPKKAAAPAQKRQQQAVRSLQKPSQAPKVVTSAPTPTGGEAERPKTREEWEARMRKVAAGRA